MRKQSENETNDNNEEETLEEESISKQEFIMDAREMRNLRMQGRKEENKSEQCQFRSSSMTLLINHKKKDHEKAKIMRKRLSFHQCGFKTTTSPMLIKHKEDQHGPKEPKQKKRKACNICGKQFNKENNLKDHMKRRHKTLEENQKDRPHIIFKENKVQS